MALQVGTQAPDFTLRSMQDGKIVDVSLSELSGKAVLLLFFPAAFTGVCTQEFCDANGASSFADLDVTTFGLSVDSVFALAAWAEKAGITTPLLSDYKREVIEAYDVVWPDLAGMGPSAARAAILIDGDGVIIYSEQTENPGGLPDFEAIRAAIPQTASA